MEVGVGAVGYLCVGRGAGEGVGGVLCTERRFGADKAVGKVNSWCARQPVMTPATVCLFSIQMLDSELHFLP